MEMWGILRKYIYEGETKCLPEITERKMRHGEDKLYHAVLMKNSACIAI